MVKRSLITLATISLISIMCGCGEESGEVISKSDEVLKKQLENTYYCKVQYDKPSSEVQEALNMLAQSYSKDEEEFNKSIDGYIESGVVSKETAEEFRKNCGYMDEQNITEEAYTEDEDTIITSISYANDIAFMRVTVIGKTYLYKCNIQNNKISEVVAYKYIIE